MATASTIEWTNKTWNPVVGCRKVSPGCAHCYAERMAARLGGMARAKPNNDRKRHYLAVIGDRGRWNGKAAVVPEALSDPLKWRVPSMIFVNSMSDLYHDDVPLDFIQQVFATMNAAPRHTYQILTKRSQRLRELSPSLPWGQHIWQGVSIETPQYLGRLADLRVVPSPIRFLSLEPLLAPLGTLDLDGISWVICGGESGPGSRAMDVAWVREIRDQCIAKQVPFFFKQWGNIHNNPDAADPTAKINGGTAKGGRTLDGVVWNQMPRSIDKQAL